MKKLLEMQDIDKCFPGVHALKRVSLDLNYGEVHALLGENGAGKSTLINVLAGIHKADSGNILIDGKTVQIHNVQDSLKYGISVVHQELVLALNMTVAENIYLNREKKNRLGFISDYAIMQDARELLQRIELNINPGVVTGELNIAQQQLVEIARALSFQSRILVLDEPTAALTSDETDKLFKVIRALRGQGVGIIYISHRMEELFQIADRVTVMRDGQYIATRDMKQTNRNELLNLMVGRKIENFYIHEPCVKEEVLFEAKNFCTHAKLKNVSINVRKSEILGIAGIVGAGRTELVRAIFGIDSISEGELFFEGRPLKIRTVKEAVNAGIALVSENRKEEGLILFQSIEFNATICVLKEFIKGCRVNKNTEKKIVSQYAEKMNLKAASYLQPVLSLSGGNQQKVVLGKWLATKPKMLILDEPTRGIDVGAKAEIYAMLDQLVHEGISVVIVSSDMEEIINLSDRTYVMYDGRIMANLTGDEITQENIMYYATGGVQT